jgi:NAD(P)-dependent dehydrogenase (short-subunit alcohol dehydrogenase family)
MPTVLITGANRGLGLEFVRQYVADGWDVIATAREPGSAAELRATGVRIEELDQANLDAVTGFGERIDQLDLLIANAGLYGPHQPRSAADGREWADTFTVNTIAPYLLAQSLLRQVRASRGKLIAVSTRMGSISDNSSGGFVSYRSSKTALNSAWRSLAVDNREVVCAVLHPGWVQTRMGGASAPLQPQESVSGMRKVVERLGHEDSGEFFDYQGQRVPW